MSNNANSVKWQCSVVGSKEEMNNMLNQKIDDAKNTNKI